MSSLAQDELGSCRRPVRPARRAHRHRPGCARLRPRARRVPPLPAARPRPGRLGDDDRPTLPVRHAPTPSGSRRSPAGTWAPLAELVGKLVREERYHRMHAEAWLDAPGARRRRAARRGCWRRSTTLGPDAATVFTPLPDEPELIEAGILDAPMAELEARWRAAIAPVARGARPADAAARPRPRPRPARPRRGVPLAVGRVHLRPPRRPGSDLVSEAGTQIGIARARAGVAVPTAAVRRPTAAAAVDARRRPRARSPR